MRHMQHRASSGFTLIEMLVVAPIIILIITGFIAVMINMVGSVLVSQERSRVTYDTEKALSQMEIDVRTATSFPTTTGIVNTPQGSGDNSGAWNTTANGPLVLSNYATTINPVNSSGDNSLFYINNKPYDCSDENHIYNPTYTLYTVYFIKSGNLYRRTIFPNVASTGKPPTSSDICDDTGYGVPWQQNSCTNGTGGYCKVKDDLVAPNISSMKLTYYDTPGSTAASTNQANASTVSITLTGSSSTAGQSFTYTGGLRANRANIAS